MPKKTQEQKHKQNIENLYWLNEEQIIKDSSYEIKEFAVFCDICGVEITGNVNYLPMDNKELFVCYRCYRGNKEN